MPFDTSVTALHSLSSLPPSIQHYLPTEPVLVLLYILVLLKLIEEAALSLNGNSTLFYAFKQTKKDTKYRCKCAQTRKMVCPVCCLDS